MPQQGVIGYRVPTIHVFINFSIVLQHLVNQNGDTFNDKSCNILRFRRLKSVRALKGLQKYFFVLLLDDMCQTVICAYHARLQLRHICGHLVTRD